MNNTIFYPNQARQIFAMVPDGTDQRSWSNNWNKCKGYDSQDMAGYYCVEFYSTENTGYMRYYFKQGGTKLDKITKLKNHWVNSPVLNRSGLATQVWDDDTANKLRRRLEQKAERATFSKDEKKKIVQAVNKFYHQVKDCLE